FGSLTFYVLKPKQMTGTNSTVLYGKIESDLTLHHLYVIDQIIQDTIATVPIKNNSFTYKFNTNVVLDYYTVIIDNKLSSQIFFGKNDSLFMEVKFLNSKDEFKTKGTRLAENQLSSKKEYEWSFLGYWLQENKKLDDVKAFSDQLYKEWKEKIAVTNKFKTVDNYVPRPDYTERNKKLICVKYLNFWDQFVKKRLALYPNQKTEENANIKSLKTKISLSDESLLSNGDYFNYVITKITPDNKKDIDANTKSIEAISKLPSNPFKDKMLFKQMTKSIEEASNNSDKDKLISKYSDLFTNKKYQTKIIGNTKLLESLAKGQPAPLFKGYTLENKLVSLADLKGKFVMVDVWATWCGPCAYQSPYFEKFALKYKKENIQFISLSIDERKDNWFIDAKSKSQSVLQLLSNNKELLGNNYNMSTIPSFILIDPNGNLVNVKMPFPSVPYFEILLRGALGLADEK
ncbi:MAG TPA: TlpA disulfide reductase family protein, partial [Bacteroidia bacterium]|nr:TlpA disulfide reductase family protein [Bacteroidia bacterium]